MGSVGGAQWRLEEEPSHDKVVPSLIGGSYIHHLKPDFDKHGLLPRLLSCSRFPGLVGFCIAGQVDGFGNISRALFALQRHFLSGSRWDSGWSFPYASYGDGRQDI